MPQDRQPKKTGLGQTIGGAIGGTLDKGVNLAVGSVGRVGRVLSMNVVLPGFNKQRAARGNSKPGSAPGIEHIPGVKQKPAEDAVRVHCIDYAPDREEYFAITDLEKFLQQPRPEWAKVRWLNVDGLHPWVVNQLKEAHQFHTLAAEDTINVPQRPKVDDYDNHLFIVGRMIRMRSESLFSEQISFYLKDGLLVTFQEQQGDVWDAIRGRIDTNGSRLRNNGPDFLLYALLDAMIDHCFPLLERYGDLLEDLEIEISRNPQQQTLKKLHAIKRELLILRRVLWPLREMIGTLHKDENECLTDMTKTYLRDVYDHAVQLIEIVETFREMGSSLQDLYMSGISNRMNEVMKVLTIMASLFIPITFIAGVYGMNFDHIPELHRDWMYPWGFWGMCGAVIIGMLTYFKKKKWL